MHASSYCNLTWAISHLVITCLLTLISLYLIILFIIKYMLSSNNLTIFMLLLLSIFALDTFAFLVWTMYHQDIYCIAALPEHEQYHHYHETVFLALYWTQTYLVPVLFYLRLRKVFNHGILQLSKCTHYIYASLFVCIAICIPIIFFLWKYEPLNAIQMATILFCATCFISIVLNASLTIVLAAKLLILHKTDHNESDNDKESESLRFISLVTKTTILVFFSSLATIVNIICVMIRNETYTIHIHWIVRYSFAVDIFTNFFCIILSFSWLDKCYQIICKPMNNGCRIYCEKISSLSFISRIDPQYNTNDVSVPMPCA
eukprot:440858_1